MRWMPKLSAKTNASGENMMTYFMMPGPVMIAAA